LDRLDHRTLRVQPVLGAIGCDLAEVGRAGYVGHHSDHLSDLLAVHLKKLGCLSWATGNSTTSS
jgi:hypothetical protein